MPPARLMLPDRGPLLTALPSVARMSLLRGAGGGKRHPRTLTTRDLAGAFRPTGRVGLSQSLCLARLPDGGRYPHRPVMVADRTHYRANPQESIF